MKQWYIGKHGGLCSRIIPQKEIVEFSDELVYHSKVDPLQDDPERTKFNIEHFKRMYLINKDRVGHLMVYDIETLSEEEWYRFWGEVKANGIKLRRVRYVCYRKKHVNIFEKYSIDELRKLYEDNRLWSVNHYFINYLNKHNDQIILNYKDNSEARYYVSSHFEYIKDKIQDFDFKSDKELNDLIAEQYAHELLCELYSEDDDNHSDMYNFVINNLQYAPIEDLQKLSKLNEQHFLIKRKGRKSRNKKIFKYDLKHNLLNTYVNRKSCMDAEQISKQALYNVLSGKRKTLNGFIYEEEQ